MASESRKTVLIALGSNLGMAVSKGVGGAVSGSSAMLAEAAHSVADTTNQLFLLTSLSLSERQADAKHPFGYGKERFFWSFMAAVFIFVSGAAFSIYEGLHRILSGHEGEQGGLSISMIVLAVGFVLEGGSLLRAIGQTRGEARRARRSLSYHVRVSRDPTTKTVVFEDSAALIGLLLAAAGLGLSHVTGNILWDGLASVCIGVLLAIVAFGLGRDTKDLLIGEAALPEERAKLEHVIEDHADVDSLVELLTMAMGPQSLLVAARFDPASHLDLDGVEQLANELDERLRDAVPAVDQVFLDPTSRDQRAAWRPGAVSATIATTGAKAATEAEG
jgi:cation diffusion facilitator family transporter